MLFPLLRASFGSALMWLRISLFYQEVSNDRRTTSMLLLKKNETTTQKQELLGVFNCITRGLAKKIPFSSKLLWCILSDQTCKTWTQTHSSRTYINHISVCLYLHLFLCNDLLSLKYLPHPFCPCASPALQSQCTLPVFFVLEPTTATWPLSSINSDSEESRATHFPSPWEPKTVGCATS